jgi:hypothetical protein
MSKQIIRTKLRSNVKKSHATLKASRMADAFMRNVLANDARRERQAEARKADRELNSTVREHHSGNGRITVWRR